MDNKHHLKAPNDDQLRAIDQLDDHSGLSTLYPHANDRWDGEIVTPEEREHRRQQRRDSSSFGIRRHFLAVGLLAPLPIVILSIFLGFILSVVTDQNIALMVIPMMLLFGVWGVATILIVGKVFRLFYQHNLRAGPFLAVLVTLLGLSLQIIYIATAPLHQQLVEIIALVCLVGLVWSVVLSYALLMLWTTPKISGGMKVSLVALLGVALLVAGTLLTLSVI